MTEYIIEARNIQKRERTKYKSLAVHFSFFSCNDTQAKSHTERIAFSVRFQANNEEFIMLISGEEYIVEIWLHFFLKVSTLTLES